MYNDSCFNFYLVTLDIKSRMVSFGVQKFRVQPLNGKIWLVLVCEKCEHILVCVTWSSIFFVVHNINSNDFCFFSYLGELYILGK